MTQKKFLVTGATGATGGYAVERLLERGHAVRALAHREDDRSKRLQELGAEVVIGDLLKLNDVRLALSGIRGHILFIPSDPHSFRRRRSLHKPPKKPRSKSWRTCHSGTHARARRARQRSITGSPSRFLTGRRCLWHISGPHSFANGCSGSLVQFGRES